MDVKAMARSKRSHTKQHQPRKPHRPVPAPTSAAPSTSAADHPKAVKAEAAKKSSLPSNWDRYDDSDEDDPLFASTSESASAELVKPKSKGADFAFLLSEAKSQSPASFPDSLDHTLPDFYEGLGSMLSARGENVLSWTGGDDFFFEDEATPNQEIPFLSLNLQTLAEELGRMDLAKRLFIEQDILPPELRALPKIEKDGKRPVSTFVEQSGEVDDNFAFRNSSKVEKGIVSKEDHSLQQDSVGTKIPRFEAGAAEAELDILLGGSFDDTQFGSAHMDKLDNMENEIDDLLQETSNMAVGHASSHSIGVIGDTTGKQLSSSSHPGTKSRVMEDFDSWLDTI